MNVATALNSRYMRYTYVMLTSLFINQPDTDIHVYLLHSDLSLQDQEYLSDLAQHYHQHIHFLEVSREMFPASLPTTNAWSLEAYYRLMLPDILPVDVDRLLYLDVDMIINKPLSELYFTDFDNFLFCACKDGGMNLSLFENQMELFKQHIAQGFTYFNSGMMLWNIEKLRHHYSFQYYMDIANQLNYKLTAPDQDLLNYIHWKQVKFVDEHQYNLFAKSAYNHGIHYEDVKRETTIVHFAGMKPWEGEYVHYDIEQLWWDYARLTPFYHELMEEFLYSCIHKPVIYETISTLSAEKKQLSEELEKSSALCQKLLQLLDH